MNRADGLVPGAQWTLLHNLAARAHHRPGTIALVDNPSSDVTYAELWKAVTSVAGRFSEQGPPTGSRVGIAMQPSAAYVAIVLGAMRAGLVPVPLNTRLEADETDAFLEPLQTSVLIVDDAYAEWAGRLGRTVHELASAAHDGPLMRRLVGAVANTDPGPWPRDDDPALVFPTGGTTGIPKGAVSTHRSLARWVASVAQGSLRPSDTIEAYFSPFFHVSLVSGLLTTLWVGGTVRVLRRFDPDRVLDAIDTGATFLQGAPTMYLALRQSPRFGSTDRSRVRNLSFGASSSTEEFARRLMVDYPRARLKTGYGATEFGPVTRVDHEDFVAGRFAGVGYPVAGATVRVVNDAGAELPAGEVGEIAVHCPWQTVGYWGRPDETAATWTPAGIRLGDLGRYDNDGWLTVLGRSKEMVVTGGENVFPAEVESALAQHPSVGDVVVYGAEDDYWGERVEAAVVAVPGRTADPEELRQFLRGRMAGYKIPRVIRIVESLPLTPNHKPDRRALRDQVARAQS